jgi:NAD(P)H-dependent FMN reductase
MVLFASARPGAEGKKVAGWVAREVATKEDVRVDLVDAASLDLPFFNEAAPPLGLKEYTNPKGAEWAARVDKADAIIFVTAEYNHGYNALMKNTIDWVGREWFYKPVTFVSYGAEIGGARAVEQLKQVVLQLKMIPITDPIKSVTFTHVYMGVFDESGNAKDEAKTANLHFIADELIGVAKRLQTSA